MRAPANWRQRLPSALLTLALQAGLFLLLLYSFGPMRRPQEAAHETILLLPRLVRAPPVVIDARQPPKPALARPPAPGAPPLPPYASSAVSGFSDGSARDTALLEALGRKLDNCRIENFSKRDVEAQRTCPPANLARREPPPTENGKPVKHAPAWQAEVDRRNIPFALPGAASGPLGSAGPLGILLTALANPGAFTDPAQYGFPPPERVSGAERLQRRRYEIPQCPPGMTDMEARTCRAGIAAMGRD